ncbi:leukocyte immunoglobulin-like receptor subfamily B member 2, partial [Delphinapterus leucas]|uniref:Leukocyte immunoglobulin-like receptor subfamily B member 2 n=1 Tax=Delphinapterus leucas TaxID=9749 RepID=A0A7F8K721_DELLE
SSPFPSLRGAQSPSFSAQPRPVVASGENVSLACSSQFAAGTLHLLKEGGADPPDTGHRGPMGGDRPCALSQVRAPSPIVSWTPDLSLVPSVYKEPSLSAQPGSLVLRGDSLIAGHGSTLSELHLESCDLSPQWDLHVLQLTWHLPVPDVTAQRPLELLLSGGSEDQLLPHTESGVQTGLKWYLNVLIGVSVAFVLLPLVLLVRHRGQSRRRKSDVRESRQEMGPPCSLPTGCCRGRHTAGGRQAAGQAAASEAPQDVTYAQLNHSALRREAAPPAPQSGEPPAEPSVYAALAVR